MGHPAMLLVISDTFNQVRNQKAVLKALAAG
jgi:hypothetical protein